MNAFRDAPTDLYITHELAKRTPQPPDFLREKRAIQDLAVRMVSEPEQVLPRFVDLAMEMTGGTSAGLSFLEDHPPPGVFRWRYLHGKLARFENATTPRNFSPCGITLDCNQPVLCLHPERFYDWISDAKIVVPEVLLVPLHLGAKEAMGTLWVVSDKECHFNAEHARIASELASFVGIALKVLGTEERLQVALDEQEMLTREMSHRIKNLFAVSEAMVRMAARAASSKEEMAEMLEGRFHALASAHALIRRSFSPDASPPRAIDLADLLRAVMEPHQGARKGHLCFTISGPSLTCGEHSVNAIALIFHELATNALKYGALATEQGVIDIGWTVDGETVTFQWREQGGPEITRVPDTSGFGSKLLRDTVTKQLTGKLEHRWEPGGLNVSISVPTVRLAR